jgi:hypothetical protein
VRRPSTFALVTFLTVVASCGSDEHISPLPPPPHDLKLSVDSIVGCYQLLALQWPPQTPPTVRQSVTWPEYFVLAHRWNVGPWWATGSITARDPEQQGSGRWSLTGAVTGLETELEMAWGHETTGLMVTAHRRSWDMNFFGMGETYAYSNRLGSRARAYLVSAQISCWPGANLDDNAPPGGILS